MDISLLLKLQTDLLGQAANWLEILIPRKARTQPIFHHVVFYFQVAFQMILWFLPTFFWSGTPLPVRPVADIDEEFPDRIGNLPTNYDDTDYVAVYNRLLSPRGVTQNIAIATLLVRAQQRMTKLFSNAP